MKYWLFLSVAIAGEIIGTTALKVSDGFTRLYPSLLVAIGYAVAFYFLALTLRAIPVSVAYAIWSGVGIVLIAVVSWLLFGQKLDLPAMIGIGLIVSGIMIMSIFSNTTSH
jgi:Membrane transporters of cations and cationic drugs